MSKQVEITPDGMKIIRRGRVRPACSFQLNCANKWSVFKGIPRTIRLCGLCIKNARNIRRSRTGRIRGIRYEGDFYDPLLDNFRTKDFSIDDQANMEALQKLL